MRLQFPIDGLSDKEKYWLGSIMSLANIVHINGMPFVDIPNREDSCIRAIQSNKNDESKKIWFGDHLVANARLVRLHGPRRWEVNIHIENIKAAIKSDPNKFTYHKYDKEMIGMAAEQTNWQPLSAMNPLQFANYLQTEKTRLLKELDDALQKYSQAPKLSSLFGTKNYPVKKLMVTIYHNAVKNDDEAEFKKIYPIFMAEKDLKVKSNIGRFYNRISSYFVALNEFKAKNSHCEERQRRTNPL